MENNEFKIDESLLLDGTEKVGDTIWTVQHGEHEISITEEDRICIDEIYYTKLGFKWNSDKYPSAFKRNPFVSQYPKLMEVSDDEDKGYFEAEVLFKKDNLFWIKHSSRNNENMHIYGFEFAREIQPKAPEFSEEQIKYLKEKFNVNV